MSNQVRNKLFVRGPKEELKRFHLSNRNVSPDGKVLALLTFTRVSPLPSDKELRKMYGRRARDCSAVMDWAYKHWGTYDDPEFSEVTRRSKTSIQYTLYTVNGRPVGWVCSASRAYPKLRFSLHSWVIEDFPCVIVHFVNGRRDDVATLVKQKRKNGPWEPIPVD